MFEFIGNPVHSFVESLPGQLLILKNDSRLVRIPFGISGYTLCQWAESGWKGIQGASIGTNGPEPV